MKRRRFRKCGHPRWGANVVHNAQGAERCRTCRNAQSRAIMTKRRALGVDVSPARRRERMKRQLVDQLVGQLEDLVEARVQAALRAVSFRVGAP